MAPRIHPALLALAGVATAVPGLLLFSTHDGESLAGMYLLAGSGLVQLLLACWMVTRRQRGFVVAGALQVVTALVTFVLAYYTCWVAGFEGDCPLE